MRPIHTLFLLGLMAGSAAAQDGAQVIAASPGAGAEVEVEADAADAPLIETLPEEPATGPFPVGDRELAEYRWQNRVLLIFADTPLDPSFLRQMDLLSGPLTALEERAVVVLFDAEPAERHPIRQSLRPRGFAAVLVDKDGRVIARRPSPWDLREIQRSIDSTPLRQQEMRDLRDSIDPIRGNR